MDGDGRAKILDFGLAQTAQSTKLTRMGSTLGTVAYMSPEQARGEEVDARTDIWALGVTLYEMVAGKHPFAGDYEQAVVYSIMNEEPEPLTAVRTGVPMGLEWIVKKLLSKAADERYQSATGLLVDLKALESSLSDVSRVSVMGTTTIQPLPPNSSTSEVHGEPKRVVTPIQLIGIVGFVIVLTFVMTKMLTPTAVVDTSQGSRYLVSSVLSDGSSVSVFRQHFAVSADNKWLVFEARSDGVDRLYKLRTGQITPVEIPTTENAQYPFFSYDGRYVGFFANQSLQKVLLDGERPEVITTQTGSDFDGFAPNGAAWGAEGVIYFPLQNGIARVQASGGTPELIVVPDSGSGESYRWPHLVPDEEYLLITIYNALSGSRRLATLDLVSKQVEVLLDEEGHGAQITNSGQLLFNRFGQLMSAGFDTRDRKMSTSPTTVVGNHFLHVNGIGFGLSGSGKLVTGSRGDDGLNAYTWLWVDKEGQEVPISLLDGNGINIDSEHHRFSPDGNRVAFAEGGELAIYSILQDQSIPFEDELDSNRSAWSPDGNYLFFSIEGTNGIQIKRADLSEPRKLIFATDRPIYPTSWSQDRQTIAYYEVTEDQGRNIWMFDLADSVSTPYIVTPDNERAAYFSGDGKWIAYITDRSGRDEIWVDSFPVKGARTKVSQDGGTEPVWGPDNRFLYYRNGSQMIAAEIKLSPTFQVVKTTHLFDGPYLTRPNGSLYDIHPDGERFLMVRDPTQSMFNSLIVEENWLQHFIATQLDGTD